MIESAGGGLKLNPFELKTSHLQLRRPERFLCRVRSVDSDPVKLMLDAFVMVGQVLRRGDQHDGAVHDQALR